MQKALNLTQIKATENLFIVESKYRRQRCNPLLISMRREC